MDILLNKIMRLEGRGYKGYQELKGAYSFKKYDLHVDHVQSDPFAPPSRMRIKIPQKIAGFPPHAYATKSREIALRDFISRNAEKSISKFSRNRRGTGNSGVISVAPAGQEILERASVFINEEYVEARITAGLPAYGRKIAARQAEEMFFKELPVIAENALFFENLDEPALTKHISIMEDADYIRAWLKQQRMAAFIADGAVLPRKSGIEETPLEGDNVIPFSSPDTMRVEIILPNRGRVTGMGIREGITLIIGGGFHGKSTLLKAVERGVYNHIPGDGRECVVTVGSGVKIRAEDGRRVEKVDISPFINNLPFGRETKKFSTDNASGSTSQAANIIESIEAGAELLMLDEDTSATNFMIRDHRMQEIVPKDKEPITPFIDKVKLLFRNFGVSTIMVMGGSGDYFDVADFVIRMQDYRPHDITERAKEVAEKYKSERKKEGGDVFGEIKHRVPRSESFNPSKGGRSVKIAAKGLHAILFGRNLIDLSAVEQLVDIGQTKALADAVYYAIRYMDGKNTLRDVINRVAGDIENKGIDILGPFISGEYVFFRKHELSAAINRLRTFSVR